MIRSGRFLQHTTLFRRPLLGLRHATFELSGLLEGSQQESLAFGETIHWHGGFASQHQVVRPVGCYTQLRDYDLLISRIKSLHQEGKTIPAIAEQLNQDGFVPPRRRGTFSVRVLAPLLKQLGLVGELRSNDLLSPNEWWIHDLAAQLNLPACKVYYWAKQGWIHSRRTVSGKHWIIWADRSELARLKKLQLQSNSYTAKRHPKLVTPKARKG